ncbi:hypothetical protein BC940DRAFT_309599 [Gongronella butleri]|nr:hypothetical protein BC940DRAFT_309599 [Gongronella butleri]
MPLPVVACSDDMPDTSFLVQVKTHDQPLQQTLSSSVQSTSSSDYSEDSGNDLDCTSDLPPADLVDAPHQQATPLTLPPAQEGHLSATILALFEQLLPTNESYERRMGFVAKIERILTTEWPDKEIKVHLFGSSVNDLGTSQSDVDLCITTQWNGLRNVRVLAKLFRKCGMQHVVCIPRAKVPIVRLVDPEYQMACDMNVNNTLALQNTKMIRTYVAIDPRVRPLTMMIKYWTKQRVLNDAANGGTLSTYTWNCMIIHFLQMRQPPILPVLHQLKGDDEKELFCADADKLRGFGDANRESLGGLLFAFFRRYALEFDYDDQVISVRHGRYLTKREKGWHIGRNKTSLCVEEPFNVTRNLGNSADVYSVRGIRDELRRAMEMLVEGASWYDVCAPYRPPIFGKTTAAAVHDPNAVTHYASTLAPASFPPPAAAPIPILPVSPVLPAPSTPAPAHSLAAAASPPSPMPVQVPLDQHYAHQRKRQPSVTSPVPTHVLLPPTSPSMASSPPHAPITSPPMPSHAYPHMPHPHHHDHHAISPVPIHHHAANGMPPVILTYIAADPMAQRNYTYQSLVAIEPRSVDTIFARYHHMNNPAINNNRRPSAVASSSPAPSRRPSPPEWPSIGSSTSTNHPAVSMRPSMSSSSSSSRTNSPATSSSSSNGRHHSHHLQHQHHQHHQHHHTSHQQQNHPNHQQQRRRRWSTAKKPTASDHPPPPPTSIEIKLPNKERTMADIVRVDPQHRSHIEPAPHASQKHANKKKNRH